MQRFLILLFAVAAARGALAADRLGPFLPEPLTAGQKHTMAVTGDFTLTEIHGAPVRVHATLTATTSGRVAEKQYDLAPFEERSIGTTNVLRLLGPIEATFEIEGEGRVMVLLEAQVASGTAPPSGTKPSVTKQLLTSPFQAAPFADPATGLVFMRNRWYDPQTGTFLTPDPMGYADSSSLYAFAGGDPVNGRDPTGLQTHVKLTNPVAGQTAGLTENYFRTNAEYFDWLIVNGVDPQTAMAAVARAGHPDAPMAPDALPVFTRAAAIASPLTTRLEGGFGVIASVAQGYAAAETGNPTMGVLAINNGIASGKLMITGTPEPSMLSVALQNAYQSEFAQAEAADRAALVEISINIGAGFTPGSRGRVAIGNALEQNGVTTPSKRWVRGESIVRRTAAGNSPAWETVRSRYWKNDGMSGPPRRVNAITGEIESMELNHRVIPQRWEFVPRPLRNGRWNLEKVWPQQHAAVDWYRWQTLDPRLKAVVPEPQKPWF